MEDRIIRRLVISQKCSVCGQPYPLENIDIVSRQGNLWLLKLVCSACRTQSLVVAVIRKGKTSGIISELSEDECEKFKNARVLSADDVLDMHDFLKGFSGDFVRIFNPK